MMERDRGLFGDSDRHFLAAIESARRSRQPQMVARLEVQRAYVLIQLGRLEEAGTSLSAAGEYSRTSGDHSAVWNRSAWTLLYYRGLMRVAANEFEAAIEPLESARQGFRRAKQTGPAGLAAIELAWCYYRLGQYERALSLYQESLGMVDAGDRHLALGNLGNIFFEQRDFSKAVGYYRQAAALAKGRSRSAEVKWLNNLASALISQAKWTDAEEINQQVLELEDGLEASPSRPTTWVNSGVIETHNGNYSAAERILRQAAESRINISASLDADSALAEVYARIGKPDAARSQFDTALALADQTSGKLREDENKLSYLSSLIDLNRKYVDFLMGRGDQAGAFAVAESSRARLLRERLDLTNTKVHNYTIARYQAAARAIGATFLAYWIGPERSYLWAISGAQFRAFPVPPEPQIRGLVERYQRAIERDASAKADDVSAGAILFRVLLPDEVLKTGGRYLIVPDGPLYALNFETLPVPGNRPRYWIEDAAVAVAPSLDLLLANQVEPSPGRSLLLVGDANEWNPQYPKLLHASKEMAEIERLFPAGGRKVLAEADATAAAYRRSNPAHFAYIHFTAHAIANKNSPFDSAIILTRETPSAPGKLSAKEVLGTRVHAELVTISACHSAGARTYWGEGLVGFAWAFLQSGARGVIAGLWDVSDYSSPRLMHDLYAGLAVSQTPTDALRAAKLNLIRSGKYAEPYYWGAFQLYQGALYSGKKAQPLGGGGIQNAELRR
jgi:CHAT domain-containing protein/Tfp pilus assembly protein PilF